MRTGKNWVRLDDGTCWSFDRPTTDGEYSLEWYQRYGLVQEVYGRRLIVAGVLESYKALVRAPAKRRSEVVRAIRTALALPPSSKEKKT